MKFILLYHPNGKVWGGLLSDQGDSIIFGGTSPGQALQVQKKRTGYIADQPIVQ